VAEVVGAQRDERASCIVAEDSLAGTVPDAEHGEGWKVVGAALADEQAAVGGGPERVEVPVEQRCEFRRRRDLAHFPRLALLERPVIARCPSVPNPSATSASVHAMALRACALAASAPSGPYNGPDTHEPNVLGSSDSAVQVNRAREPAAGDDSSPS
jgi:hypothetical protein